MKTLILTVCFLLGLTATAENYSSEDPNLRRGFDGALTFFDPTNKDCKPCQAYLRNRQNFKDDVSGNFAPSSLARGLANQPTKPGLNPASGVNTGK
jgi:hypothetical protein